MQLQHENDKVQVKSTSCPWFIGLSKSNSLINFNSPCNQETFNLKLQKLLTISKRKENKHMKTKFLDWSFWKNYFVFSNCFCTNFSTLIIRVKGWQQKGAVSISHDIIWAQYICYQHIASTNEPKRVLNKLRKEHNIYIYHHHHCINCIKGKILWLKWQIVILDCADMVTSFLIKHVWRYFLRLCFLNKDPKSLLKDISQVAW